MKIMQLSTNFNIGNIVMIILAPIRLIGLILRIIIKFEIEHAFEPKVLRVKDYWISGIFKKSDGKIDIIQLIKPSGARPTLLHIAAKKLREEWENLGESKKNKVIIPIWCMHGLTPFAEGVRSLLVFELPSSMSSQISSLKLVNPTDIVTLATEGESGAIVKSIVDISPDKIIIVGNARRILASISCLGSRFDLSHDNKNILSDKIRKMLISQNIEPLESGLLIGGFGALFAFESAFLFNKVLLIPEVHFIDLFVFILSMLSITFFLVQEAFDSRTFAFSATWTFFFNVISWVLFLFYIIGSPILIFGSVEPYLLLSDVRIFSIILIVSCFTRNLGQIFFQYGLSKKLMLTLWLFFLVVITNLPLLLKLRF